MDTFWGEPNCAPLPLESWIDEESTTIVTASDHFLTTSDYSRSGTWNDDYDDWVLWLSITGRKLTGTGKSMMESISEIGNTWYRS